MARRAYVAKKTAAAPPPPGAPEAAPPPSEPGPALAPVPAEAPEAPAAPSEPQGESPFAAPPKDLPAPAAPVEAAPPMPEAREGKGAASQAASDLPPPPPPEADRAAPAATPAPAPREEASSSGGDEPSGDEERPRERKRTKKQEERDEKEDDFLRSVASGYAKILEGLDPEFARTMLANRLDPEELAALIADKEIDPDVHNLFTHNIQLFLREHPALAGSTPLMLTTLAGFFAPRYARTVMVYLDTAEQTDEERKTIRARRLAWYREQRAAREVPGERVDAPPGWAPAGRK
jgi:hypothetical protein